jgi:hypothetical protein
MELKEHRPCHRIRTGSQNPLHGVESILTMRSAGISLTPNPLHGVESLEVIPLTSSSTLRNPLHGVERRPRYLDPLRVALNPLHGVERGQRPACRTCSNGRIHYMELKVFIATFALKPSNNVRIHYMELKGRSPPRPIQPHSKPTWNPLHGVESVPGAPSSRAGRENPLHGVESLKQASSLLL